MVFNLRVISSSQYFFHFHLFLVMAEMTIKMKPMLVCRNTGHGCIVELPLISLLFSLLPPPTARLCSPKVWSLHAKSNHSKTPTSAEYPQPCSIKCDPSHRHHHCLCNRGITHVLVSRSHSCWKSFKVSPESPRGGYTQFADPCAKHIKGKCHCSEGKQLPGLLLLLPGSKMSCWPLWASVQTCLNPLL